MRFLFHPGRSIAPQSGTPEGCPRDPASAPQSPIQIIDDPIVVAVWVLIVRDPVVVVVGVLVVGDAVAVDVGVLPVGDAVLVEVVGQAVGLSLAMGAEQVRVHSAGTAEVLIDYRRRWEKDKPAEKTFSLKVTVVE